jgi:hypothetical protein
MNGSELFLSASIKGSTGPLGTPNTQRTPLSCKIPTIKSLLFIVDVGVTGLGRG